MTPSFVIEAVMLAAYGQLVFPAKPVHYLIPYTTILELYEMNLSEEPIMYDPDEDMHVRGKIQDLLAYFESDLNRKKIDQIFALPWKKSLPMVVNERVTISVIHGVDDASFGEAFDPVETELLLTALREKIPILTDQTEFIDRVIEAEIPVQLWDIDDFEFALEAADGQNENSPFGW
ncbi:hypothetical protein BSNK01_25070 [Bacillaceae bacterium]